MNHGFIRSGINSALRMMSHDLCTFSAEEMCGIEMHIVVVAPCSCGTQDMHPVGVWGLAFLDLWIP